MNAATTGSFAEWGHSVPVTPARVSRASGAAPRFSENWPLPWPGVFRKGKFRTRNPLKVTTTSHD